LVFNDRLDAAVASVLAVLVAVVLIESGLEWARVISGRKACAVEEAPFVMTRLAAEEVG
jgi:hypothetical protein